MADSLDSKVKKIIHDPKFSVTEDTLFDCPIFEDLIPHGLCSDVSGPGIVPSAVPELVTYMKSTGQSVELIRDVFCGRCGYCHWANPSDVVYNAQHMPKYNAHYIP
jgi:hypothetical protein